MKKPPTWTLHVAYPSMPGFIVSMDGAANVLAGRSSSGSGLDLETGKRDLDFVFYRKARALAAADRLEAAGFRVELVHSFDAA